MGADSLMPKRSCRRRRGAGAHQLKSPARRMKAGTRAPRTRVASMAMATASPTPKSLMNDTPEVAKAKKTAARSRAAAVTMRPLRSRPRATDETLSWVRSYSSLIRLRRKTS